MSNVQKSITPLAVEMREARAAYEKRINAAVEKQREQVLSGELVLSGYTGRIPEGWSGWWNELQCVNTGMDLSGMTITEFEEFAKRLNPTV